MGGAVQLKQVAGHTENTRWHTGKRAAQLGESATPSQSECRVVVVVCVVDVVGCAEGTAVGDALGVAVGENDGVAVGVAVGVFVGMPVGDAVGVAVG